MSSSFFDDRDQDGIPDDWGNLLGLRGDGDPTPPSADEAEAAQTASQAQAPVQDANAHVHEWARRLVAPGERTLVGSVGDWRSGASNQPADVLAVQDLLLHASKVLHNKKLEPHGEEPGVVTLLPLASPTVEAIRVFQRSYCRMRRPDGRVDPKGQTLARLNALMSSAPAPVAMPKWIEIARQEIGVREEGSGKTLLSSNNPRILEYITTFDYLSDISYRRLDKKTGKKVKTGYMMSEVDETPWCACFVNWCLKKAGQATGPNARAKDWLEYGNRLEQPRFGAITVVYKKPGRTTRGTTSSGYHVAFYISGIGKDLVLLGGNQGNKVCEIPMSGWTVMGYRWPR